MGGRKGGAVKYVIAVFAVLLIAAFAGMVFAIIDIDAEDEEERAQEDREQEEYLRRWYEKHGK